MFAKKAVVTKTPVQMDSFGLFVKVGINTYRPSSFRDHSVIAEARKTSALPGVLRVVEPAKVPAHVTATTKEPPYIRISNEGGWEFWYNEAVQLNRGDSRLNSVRIVQHLSSAT